ncbi:sensor histidine kinase [Enterococcus moraviensis ATCC BAA-383]|uniref:histidine kinase n=1 Tax=Enterococcus moraviensis ATCC BAA-383 TaxID=1158609 RepID=R2TJ08_9ENTE|nr:sensor histidine kinase [Enterococcus moraviensis]EOI05099.1 sensor histidine kinase [Enterococcus moraviensis ATCC BAA-383]EOT63882.1 sensor histidine kinase [Enterococcus moraviensis ATCC BAA-383]OJG65640.1 sensor histidine kinase [Enterococcus moraviensis]
MTIRNYLKDHWLLLIGWLFFIGVTCFILWLSPDMVVNFSVIGYLVLLQGLFLLLFLTIDYSLKKRWWRSLDISEHPPSFEQYLGEASKSEEKLVQHYINGLLVEHQQEMQQAINNQQDQKDYIDSWVHEIKVPLAAVNLILQSIEDDIPEKKYYLVENELGKIDEYVEQVLYYARLDTFSRDYLIQEYSLKEIVQSVIRTQGNYFIQKNLRFSIEGNDQMILTDAKWVAFIFKQLVSNAIKYTPAGGEISVTLSRTKEGAWLSLKDTGIGIPKEDQRRIFDKGFTGENGRTSEQHSTGLGLYLAKSLADKLGHQLTMESVEGEGTTMKLLFPFLSYFNERR